MIFKEYEFIASPNHYTSPLRVKFAIIHGTVGNFESALHWLTHSTSEVSAHFLIGKNGRTVQLVDTGLVAWHAGKSRYKGYESLNKWSIGIELEILAMNSEPYTEEQYIAAAELGKKLMKAYQELQPQEFVGHSDISLSGKIDPGPMWDWNKFRGYLRGQYSLTTDSWQAEFDEAWEWVFDNGLIKGDKAEPVDKQTLAVILRRLQKFNVDR